MALSRQVAEHADELAALEQRDCGKPTKQAQADAAALARYFEFYAGACDKLHGETLPYQSGYSVFTWREPHGVTGHVIPWNYPMQIFGRSVGGALAAGNCCVVKPSEDACLSLIRVAQLAAEVGFPAGAINMVTGYGHEVGDALARYPGVDHISFTGSPKVGTLIQQVAAERHCPVTLELGGKSPQIIFADADLDAALPVVINAIVQNGGQTCSAGAQRVKPISRANLKRLRRTYWWVVGVGALFTLARFSEAFLVLRAEQTGVALALVPLVMVAMNAVYSICAYPLGKLADRLPHRRLLLWGLVALIAADLVLALATHWGGLLLGVALWGLHMGMTQGLLAAMVADAAPADLRGTAYGFFNLVSGVAMLLASVLAGLLWQYLGPAWTFGAGAAFCVLTMLGMQLGPHAVRA